MNDSLNNKELVAVGHEFAKTLSSDTPIIDMAKMLTRLAERLDCTTAALRVMTKERDALAAMQPQVIRKALDRLESFRTAFMEYSDKTDWVQTDKRFDVIKPWGKHRADVLRDFIEHLESKLEAKDKTWAAQDDHINQQAGRIESLERKNSKLGKALGAADKRIAELEANNDSAHKALLKARHITVSLPDGYTTRAGHPINETERGVMIPKDNGPWLSRHDVEHALRVAGISIKGE